MQAPITISAIASVSALGNSPKEVWRSYVSKKPLFIKKKIGSQDVFVSEIASEIEKKLEVLRASNPSYKILDRTVLLAMLASTEVLKDLPFLKKNMGVNIGSSRGATSLFEKYHTAFAATGKVSPFTSPTTTLGNISSWVSQELDTQGVQIDQSVTCSTAMHALLNGIAWLQADMADAFLVGGSEAALTPFTIAQMQALKLYTKSTQTSACESMRFQKTKNTMVLGEGAAVAVLEKGISVNTKAIIKGYGFGSEILAHNSSISENANSLQKAMKMALEKAALDSVDAIIMHAPGTVKGDVAEKNAIDIVFQKQLPLLTSNKWMVGHTFAASGMLSIEMAVYMLQHNIFIENPFYSNTRSLPSSIKTVLVNAVGFGGNAVSIILSRPN
ncbi:MAG: 3-oxoacyl-[acyl-carrier-protein] synthase II [Patiriisocius sp.]